MTKHVLLVEDHPMARLGLKLMLEQDPDYALAGEAKTGQEAVSLVNQLMIAPGQLDLVLMDIGMPDMDGIEATQLIKRQWPTLPVLMLTSKDNATEVKAAMAAGADGYCLKGQEFEPFKQVMDTVAAGNVWLDRHIARLLLCDLQTSAQPPQPGEAVVSRMASSTVAPVQPASRADAGPLTERELEVLRLIVDGLNNQQISDKLYISIATTKAHVHSILQKLCLDDRTQAAVWAMRRGLA